MSKTVEQLKNQITAQVFPSGAPENLVAPVIDGTISPIDGLFDEAFAEIAKWVAGERENHSNTIPFLETYYKCGMTAVTVPRGIVRRVYTVVENEEKQWCDPVFYKHEEWPAPEDWARNYLFPTDSSAAQGDGGIRPADPSTDYYPDAPTVAYPRARTGIFSIYDSRLWVAPWLQSNEVLIVEWSGIKTEWDDADLINPDQDYAKAVKLYIQFAFERDYGDRTRAADFKALFAEALADLMWEDRERTKKRPATGGVGERNRTSSELGDDNITTPTQEYQTITGDDTVDLDYEITLLDAQNDNTYAVVLPDGDTSHIASAKGRMKQIYIPKANENTTATFVITGNIVGFTQIRFNRTGYSALLKWIPGGGGWTWVGGNALLE
jgi:hypothetical protein